MAKEKDGFYAKVGFELDLTLDSLIFKKVKTAKQGTSGIVYLPKGMIGRDVMVIAFDPRATASMNAVVISDAQTIEQAKDAIRRAGGKVVDS